MRLKVKTPKQWLDTVLADFDAFLVDHAQCERKASALAMSIVAHFRDKPELIRAMIDLAIEELEHFKMVNELLEERGLMIGPDEKDHYVNQLIVLIRKSGETYLLDRLLVAGVIEARGTERFGLVAEALSEAKLKNLYAEFTRAEARHHGLFVRLAKKYYDVKTVEDRLEEILLHEAKIVAEIPFRAAVH